MQKSLITIGLTAGVCLSSQAAGQPPNQVPRGPDILAQASNCNIGPFEQVGKAGRYNELCTTLTDAEKCLALIKGHMDSVGQIAPASPHDHERVNFCLGHFADVLVTE